MEYIFKSVNKLNRLINTFSLCFIFFCLSFILQSCTGSQNGDIDVDLTIEELIHKVNNNSAKLKSLQAEGTIDIDSPGLSNSGSITVNLLKPDSLYVKLEGPFGIDVADVLLTRKKFVYYNVMNNSVIKGPATPLNIGSVMRIKIDFYDIINGFSGTFFFKDVSTENSSLTSQGDEYLLITKDAANNETKKYWINSDDYYITKYIIYDKDNKVKLEMEYLDYNYRDGIYFPNNISISKPQDEEYIWLYYQIKTFNTKKLIFKFKIPQSAKVTIWE